MAAKTYQGRPCISRKAARVRGLKRSFGKPCKRARHSGERHVTNGGCVEVIASIVAVTKRRRKAKLLKSDIRKVKRDERGTGAPIKTQQARRDSDATDNHLMEGKPTGTIIKRPRQESARDATDKAPKVGKRLGSGITATRRSSRNPTAAMRQAPREMQSGMRAFVRGHRFALGSGTRPHRHSTTLVLGRAAKVRSVCNDRVLFE